MLNTTNIPSFRSVPIQPSVAGTPFSSVKNGFAALETMPAFGIFQIVAFVGLLEIGYTHRKAEIEEVHLAKSKWSLGEQQLTDKELLKSQGCSAFGALPNAMRLF